MSLSRALLVVVVFALISLGYGPLLPLAHTHMPLGITWGTWIQIGIPLLLALIALLVWLFARFYLPTQYFQAVFLRQRLDLFPPSGAYGKDYERTMRAGVVDGHPSEVQLAVFATHATTFTRVDVRLLERKRFNLRQGHPFEWFRCVLRRDQWHNLTGDRAAKITYLREKPKRHGRDKPIRHRVEAQGAGGVRLFYDEPQKVNGGEFLWFIVGISATKNWDGWIGFEATMPDGRLARSHRACKITVGKTLIGR